MPPGARKGNEGKLKTQPTSAADKEKELNKLTNKLERIMKIKELHAAGKQLEKEQIPLVNSEPEIRAAIERLKA